MTWNRLIVLIRSMVNLRLIQQIVNWKYLQNLNFDELFVEVYDPVSRHSYCLEDRQGDNIQRGPRLHHYMP